MCRGEMSQRFPTPIRSGPDNSGSGQVQSESCGRRDDVRAGHARGEHSKIRIAGVSDGSGDADLSVPVRQPAAGCVSATCMNRIVKLMLFAVGQGDERFHQRTQRNRLVGIVPTRREQDPGLDIQKEIRDFPAGKFPLQNLGSGLREQRISDDRIFCERLPRRAARPGSAAKTPISSSAIDSLHCDHW